jgi:hypothetical protein
MNEFMKSSIREARELNAKCWTEYKETIPPREIMRGIALIPILLARIDELESILPEERARGNHYGISYEDLAKDRKIERWIIDGEKDMSKKYLDLMRKEARRQLQMENKI